MASERKPPGIFAVFLGAVLSVALGGLLGGIHLASQPVEVMKTAPKEAPPAGKLYYVLGAAGSTAGSGWKTKSEVVASGVPGAVAFTEAELNAWSGATFEQAKIDAEKKNQTVMILAGAPNFRIDGSTLHVGLVNTVSFFGSEAPLVLQARGGFEKGGSGWRFAPSEAKLGALPLHKIPLLQSVIADRFGAASPPAAVEKVLRDAREIAVRDGALVVAF